MARRRGGRGWISVTTDVEIPIDEALEEIDDEELREECARRGLVSEARFEVDLVRQAYEDLRCGRNAAALALLDRVLFPTSLGPTSGAILFPGWVDGVARKHGNA